MRILHIQARLDSPTGLIMQLVVRLYARDYQIWAGAKGADARRTSVKAMVVDQYGGPDVPKVKDVLLAHPGPGQVRIRLATAGVNFVNIQQRRGNYLDRLVATCCGTRDGRQILCPAYGHPLTVWPVVASFQTSSSGWGSPLRSDSSSSNGATRSLSEYSDGYA
jgi:hypothetical protein